MLANGLLEGSISTADQRRRVVWVELGQAGTEDLAVDGNEEGGHPHPTVGEPVSVGVG